MNMQKALYRHTHNGYSFFIVGSWYRIKDRALIGNIKPSRVTAFGAND